MGQALYHDGACTCATLANLTQKVGLPGRGTFHGTCLRKIVTAYFTSDYYGSQRKLRHGQGTGTRPYYLVNRVLTKNEGPHPKFFYTNREIVVE